MITDLKFYKDAGEDMAEAVKGKDFKTIKEIFRWMVEAVAMEVVYLDKNAARETFFVAFEEEMG